ncbi:hydantoinase B/oxoprolinase family protein [Mucisphaera calidilacus]|uniref:Acetophenone carboxylase delta subunit n=1 Tax=Mucisphaera calidilacus TaxID=2527982 RepID=A0A518BY29_9BACT|nr:hydantoinase B/oxoprolinase family protein [Mucisphaera calidilacus]QDU71872.1 Acetophenone carboxylase delta subunit [Mucisphaera calidilacus]
MSDDLGPIQIELFKHLLASVAEEMGVRLMRSAYSPNIKERRDHSCAVFDAEGRLIAQAAHIPVHLGSAAASVCAVMDVFDPMSMRADDRFILNDPYAGGTHLPDVTAVAPVVVEGHDRPLFYVANRAHHADVGGSRPGSLPLSRSIDEEGVRFGPSRFDAEFINSFADQTRTPDERRGDLFAQMAGLELGIERMCDLCARQGTERTVHAGEALRGYTERMMRHVIADLPDGGYSFEDVLDNDPINPENGPVAIRVTVTIQGETATVDYSGSDGQMAGPLNAVRAITLAATQYVFRCLGPADVPDNAGLLAPLDVVTRPGSVVDAQAPAAVAGGNVETSQRIVDVLFGALAQATPERVPAASAGSMTNLTMGGDDHRRTPTEPFTYYETIAGGAGAGPRHDGASCVHVHMTNTLNTPVETFEHAYPVLIDGVRVHDDSGGAGLHRGGDGMVRTYRFTGPTEVTLIAERHMNSPYGLAGGQPGSPGRARLIRADGSTQELGGRFERRFEAGECLEVCTPAGGGWGTTEACDKL